MPLDPYRLPDPALSDYVVQSAALDCFEDATGRSYTPVTYDPAAPPSKSWNQVGRRLFNADVASTYGYHEAPQFRQSEPESEALLEFGLTLSDADYDSYITCQHEARSDLGIQTGEDWVGFAIFQMDPELDPVVRVAADRWRECIAASDLVDEPVPSSPTDMPPPWVLESFSDTPPWQQSPATDREIALAVADATCRDTSGYTDAYYQASWTLQEEYLRENYTALEVEREKIDEATAIYLEYIRNEVTNHPGPRE